MPLVKKLSIILLISGLISACGSEKAQAPDTAASTERALPEAAQPSVPEAVETQDLAVLDTGKLEEELQPKAVKPAARAKAVSPQKVHDFGFIDEGDKIRHTFIIKNTGNATLKINDVETACGCTVAELSTRKVEPGKSAEVKTVFDSMNKFGTQNKEITVLTNVGPVKFALKGVVRPKGFKPAGDSTTKS